MADLSAADLEETDLELCDLSGAELRNARWGSAKLMRTNLASANMRGAHDLTGSQLAAALTTRTTILPDGSKGPYRPGSGAERPS
jgi:uncharacterized protein YjbI with pentapeptide repeats